jgi:pilus assembly protein Flp/PilA
LGSAEAILSFLRECGYCDAGGVLPAHNPKFLTNIKELRRENGDSLITMIRIARIGGNTRRRSGEMLARLWVYWQCFKRDEKGIALTEYLILLGLLTGAVIVAVLGFGEQLGTLWEEWNQWLRGEPQLGAPSG